MPYRTVLVGSDGSATAQLAVQEAAGVAAQHGARLVIVTAYTPRREDSGRLGQVPEEIGWAVTDVAQAEERVRHGRELASASGVGRTVTYAMPGSPADVLLDAASAFEADLVVVGSRGLTGSAHAVVGSVAASVAHHAPCDVMIVRTTGDEQGGRAEEPVADR